MLPVSAWPPGSPGASLSPFGTPRDICVPSCGYVLPKGAWMVQTGGNQVVMFRPPVTNFNPVRVPGTGILPGSTPPVCGCQPSWPKFNDQVEYCRSLGKIAPPLGKRPPNFFGWSFVNAPSATLIPTGSGGVVLADGQNVVIVGGGWANITQAYSV
jgi:hypothetical protein